MKATNYHATTHVPLSSSSSNNSSSNNKLSSDESNYSVGHNNCTRGKTRTVVELLSDSDSEDSENKNVDDSKLPSPKLNDSDDQEAQFDDVAGFENNPSSSSDLTDSGSDSNSSDSEILDQIVRETDRTYQPRRTNEQSNDPKHFRVPNDHSCGLDDISDPLCPSHTDIDFASPPSSYLDYVHERVGDNNVQFELPTIINRHNVKDHMDVLMKSDLFDPKNIVLVFNGCGDDLKRPIPQNPSALDPYHMKNYNIKYLVVIEPPKRGHDQIYIVDEAKRAIHHESYKLDVLTAVLGSDLTLLYHPNDKNCRTAHSIVVNDQDDLAPFSTWYNTEATDDHIKRYGVAPKINADGTGDNVTRIDSKTCNGGMCLSRNMYVPTKEDLNKKTNTLSLLNPNLQDLILDCQVSIPRIHEGTEQQVVTDKMIFLSAILYFFFRERYEAFTIPNCARSSSLHRSYYLQQK